ncbi:hypothetical protein JW899_02355 [Candidatus Uhrbacteria bacterium]|nr:hypothetical protein [Candidatus Uhrbacteria bacterium]
MNLTEKCVLTGGAVALSVSVGMVYGTFFLDSAHSDTSVIVSSIMIPRDVGELSLNSDAVIVGVVDDIAVNRERSIFRAGEHDVVTTATVRVDRYLSNYGGLDAQVVKVKALGGTVGDHTMVAEGSPDFELGSKVVVFIYRFGKGDDYWVAGEAQGKFIVNENDTLGTERERPFVSSVFGKDDVTLSELESQIDSAVK